MARTLTAHAVIAINSPETDKVFVALLTLTATGMASPIRLCSDPTRRLSTDPLVYGLTSRSVDFYFCPFDLVLPSSSEDKPPRARLAIDNIDRAIMADLRTLTSPLEVLIEVVRANNLDTLEFSIPGFQLRDVTYDAQRIEGDLMLRDLARDPYPVARFTPALFPGLF